jgi:energy-coupling factor transporter ATP-binding protein EcfA2
MGKKTRRQTAPAEGERAAIGGYHPQYRISADTILQSLRHETLEWIRLADPKAGRVDDFQIGTPGRVDGYQVKWSRDGGNFTFRDLIVPETEKPCLIAQLADGWTVLQRNHPNRRVVVHLRTNLTPSVTKLLDRAGVAGKGSFSEFLNQVWYPAHDRGNAIHDEWQPVWGTLVQASNLSAADFADFVNDCELEFGVHLPGEAGGGAMPDPVFARDIRQLTEFLQDVVAAPEQVVELSRASLLGQIGWAQRLAYVSRHDFPDPTIPYREIEATANRLRVALQNVPRGYITLLGDPGSGKSTLLTKTLEGLPYRVIRYYAFVPDASDPRILRGEATSFLHDITLALDRCGFRVGRSISDIKDVDQLAQRLHEQLRLLHQDWLSTGCKTVILVDGLDHIPRELKPRNTLLNYLPPPDQIPDGIVIVLGSQTDQLTDLPHSVHRAIQNPDRRIQMERLSRESVIEVLQGADLPIALTASQLTVAEELAAGHPLALALLVNRLGELAGDQTVDAILSSAEPFGGRIDEMYYSHWRQVIEDRQDSELAALLGKLVRLRPTLEMRWLESWAGVAVVNRLRRYLYHLFRREGRDRWYIFHNSFRQFLLQRTAESPPDGFDEERDRRIHFEIADVCATQRAESCWGWEEAYHRHRAGQHREAVELANTERLRSHLFACRPIDSIQEDIRTAVASAGELRDFVSVVRLLFVAAEFGSREEAMSGVALPELLLGINETEKAFAHVRDGRRLRLSPQGALDLSRDLAAMGCHEEARLVFGLAEPVDLLKGPQKDPALQVEQVALLDSWAQAAPSFRPIAEVVKLIRGTRCHGDLWHRDSDPSGKILALQNRMLFYAGEELIGLSKWDDLELLFGELNESDSPGTDEQFWLCANAWETCYAGGDLPRARTFVERAAAILAAEVGDDEMKIRLAEGTLRVLGNAERAKDLLGAAKSPSLTTGPTVNERLDPYMQRFRYNRLLYTFGERRSAAELIPDVLEGHWQGTVLFERGLSEIARIWAMSWRGILLNGPMFVQEAGLLLRMFSRNWNDDEHAHWNLLIRLRSEFYTLLVRCAQQHGPEAVRELASAFANEWFESDRSRHWPLNDVRAITRALFQAGAERHWCRDVLERAQGQSTDDGTTADRISWRESQAQGWILIGEIERARVLLDQMLRLSAGIGYRKDYQLDFLIEWMRMVNRAQPESARERVRFLASAVVSMVESTEGRAAASAAELLLKAAFEWSPRRAVSLCRLLSQHGVIGYADAAAAIAGCGAEASESSCEICLWYCADLLIPISTSSDGPLLRAVIERFGRARGSEAAKQAACLLLNAVGVYGLPEIRTGWRQGIRAGLRGLGIPLDNFDTGQEPRAESNEGSPDRLVLGDGRELSRHEVSAEIRTADDLCSLVEAEAGGSYFDWTSSIRELAGRMNVDEVVALAARLQLRRREAIGISALAERLRELGDRARAWEVGLQAVACANESGWDRHYDGGTMQAAFRTLVQIDPERARPLAFDAFIEYLGGEWQG